MMMLPKIVVVTPVKNEAWILDRFLSVTSQFADQIVVADQESTDKSVAICRKYPKVTVIQNNSSEFNEADRQKLLINKARELVPEHKIILALDADEILAANALKTTSWQEMLLRALSSALKSLTYMSHRHNASATKIPGLLGT
jgi:glycosyltransferase involved in cell wall biosynthesis